MCTKVSDSRYIKSSPISEIHTLRAGHVSFIATELHRWARAWDIDSHVDCDGHVMLCLTPPGSDLDDGYVLSQNASGFELARLREDHLLVLGSFVRVEHVMDRILAEVGSCRAAGPTSVPNTAFGVIKPGAGRPGKGLHGKRLRSKADNPRVTHLDCARTRQPG